MVDYEHPIIVRMKEAYRMGFAAGDALYGHKRWNPEDSFDCADIVQILSGAVENVLESIKEIKLATDMLPNERDYYTFFISSHLTNLQKWLNDAEEYHELTLPEKRKIQLSME